MRTQRYLPRIQNGRVTKRQTRSKNPVTSKSFGAAKSSARRNSTRISSRAGKRNSEERGARVMWMMILIGIALTAGFVFALRSQISAYRLGQAEEQLRTKLDEYAGQQKFLMLDQQRALNTTESDRAGKLGGLNQLKLDRVEALRDTSVPKAVQQVSTPVKPPEVSQQNRLNNNRVSNNRLSRQPVKNSRITKSAAKTPPSKAGAAKSSAVKSKAKKESAKQQQVARLQKKR